MFYKLHTPCQQKVLKRYDVSFQVILFLFWDGLHEHATIVQKPTAHWKWPLSLLCTNYSSFVKGKILYRLNQCYLCMVKLDCNVRQGTKREMCVLHILSICSFQMHVHFKVYNFEKIYEIKPSYLNKFRKL